jgi:tRNA nucleotidyltransferase (CCA-adding enzyme)
VSGSKRDRAIKAHEEMRGVLEADPKLQEWGIETVLIGSYARRTGIYPDKDVDVFVKLTELTTESVQPATVYNRVRDVLRAHYGERAKPQARSIKVEFDFDGDGFSVDAVPAVRMGSAGESHAARPSSGRVRTSRSAGSRPTRRSSPS